MEIAAALRGDRIKEALQLQGRNQDWLAEQIGVTKQAIGKTIRTGQMTLPHAIATARALNVSLDWLAGLDTTAAALDQVVGDLSDDDRQLTLDFLLYRVERADANVLAAEKAARYIAMIERIKQDMTERGRRDP